MIIYDYTTAGGKDLIMEYVQDLSEALKAEILDTRQLIREKGKSRKKRNREGKETSKSRRDSIRGQR